MSLKGGAHGLVLALLCCPACGGPALEPACGPSSARVQRVVDGDTVELEGGERVRYLMVDTPELGEAPECGGEQARQANASLVEGQRVSLRYDPEVCRDDYGRLLAWVDVADREVNAWLIERGYACLLYIPPAGRDRAAELESLESAAREGLRGVWGQCEEGACP